MTIRSIMISLSALTAALLVEAGTDSRPNILFAIADDWGPHAGVYGDPAVKTPTFDQLAGQGILFNHAFASAPSCGPSRAAILTGQWHWRLEQAANMYGPIPDDIVRYTDLLEKAGYFVGYTRKGWGPVKTPKPRENPAGRRYKDFATFLADRPKDKPFCFWFGSVDPHRPYAPGSGKKSGIPLDQIELPADFPDHPEVRSDVADYYHEVQRFDLQTGNQINEVRQIGELDNTIIVMTSDQGMPFPRAKSNIYDAGMRVPLAIYWPGHIKGGHRIEDFVSLTDLAPTFLELAGLPVPDEMTGQSLLPLLTAGQDGWLDPERRHVLFGKERHVTAQAAPDSGGYPGRAIRTENFLLIRNYHPDRWPAGTGYYQQAFKRGAWFADCDNGPTKSYMIENRDKDAEHRRLYDLAFAKRPELELYDLRKDPDQQVNVAGNPEYSEISQKLTGLLDQELKNSADPRAIGGGDAFDNYPYSGGAPKHPECRNLKK